MGLELMPITKFSCIPFLFKLFNKGKKERKVNLPYFVVIAVVTWNVLYYGGAGMWGIRLE